MSMGTKGGPTGPRSERGKVRSSLNAVRHGFCGRNLLLPGEDAQLYAEKMDGVFSSLAPRNDAEAELVALVADDLHKMDRLARVEKALTLGRIEELLGMTPSAGQAVTLVEGIRAMGSAVATWSSTPMPTDRGEHYAKMFQQMADAVSLVEQTLPDLPAGVVPRCQERLTELDDTDRHAPVRAEAYQGAFDAARELLTVLLDRGANEDANQEQVRKLLADLALPDKEELAKLAKYRAMLEGSLQRRLAALEQLRRLTPAAATDSEVQRAKEYRVKLRVVA